MKNFFQRFLLVSICLLFIGSTAYAQKKGKNGSSSQATTYAVGDLVYSKKGKAEGIIFYASEDGTQAMALSFRVGKVTWGDEELSPSKDIALPEAASLEGAGQGGECLAFIKGQKNYSSTTYPAFAWAEGLGEGWVIPTRDDWSDYIMPAFAGNVIEVDGKEAFDLDTKLSDAMVKAGGKAFDNGKGDAVRYWSCNVAGDEAEAKVRVARPATGKLTQVSKDSKKPFVRAVKYFNM